ncbi:MAG TPA: hypothetical protein VH134_15455 [Candidatus Dormibacteraeota bacterium]|jgi:hypothetical protein|nr:hypothetical protein [Candidatus Dormibacteraeota bacterium]
MNDPETAALLRRWREDEARLYPVVMIRPDLYERAGLMVRALADELRAHTTTEALVAAFPDAAQTLHGLLVRTGMATEDLDLGLVTGAAFGMRHREILAAQERRRGLVLIATARDRGDVWVTLHETGNPERTGFRRLEMHLASGEAVHTFIDPDPATGRPEYGLQRLKLDPGTGDPDPRSPIPDAQILPDRQAWETAVAGLRRYIETG